MAIKTQLHALADYVRQLLNCDQVSLCLYCPSSVGCHPLLVQFYELYKQSPCCYGSLCDAALLRNERLWAICDMAIQKGQHIVDNVQLRSIHGERRVLRSGVIALLERPAGIIGFLFCAAQQENAFMEGERHLLTHYLPKLACQVEQVVSESCLALPEAVGGESNSSAMQDQHMFLSLIGHELRAPLTAIKGYTGLLQEYSLGEDSKMSRVQQRRYLESMMAQVNHLEVLIGDMLAISQIQSGRLKVHYTCVDIGELCQQVAQVVRYRIEQQHPGQYRILCSIDTDLPQVWADGDRVQQVLTNLLENACKYSPAGGLIEIHVCVPAHCSLPCSSVQPGDSHLSTDDAAVFVCVTVSDQGIGIPRQQQATLFKPFVRLAHPETSHVGGSGLGLYISRKLVEAMHGRIVLSSSEGQGTSITFMLPVVY